MLYFVSPLICERRAAEGHPRLPTDHLSWVAFISFLLICERRAAEGHPRRTTDHLSWAGGRRPPLLMVNRIFRLRFQGSRLLPTLSNGRFTHQRIAIRALEFYVIHSRPLFGLPHNHQSISFCWPAFGGP